MQGTRELFERVAKLRRLFPPGFPVMGECLVHGVEEIRLKDGGIFRIVAAYVPEEKAIELDPNIDREKIALLIGRRHGIAVKPGEVFVWLFYHELGHHLRRERCLGVERRNVEFSPTPENLEEERQVEGYARERFTEWRRSRHG
jgi:hypothetical protein